MRPIKHILIILLAFTACLAANAQEIQISGSRKAVRTSGDVLAFVTPAASLATILRDNFRYDLCPEVYRQERTARRQQ